MKALITGADGFAGNYLSEWLLECGDSVVASGPALKGLNDKCETRVLDVRSEEDCFKLLNQSKPEVVYHLAAITFVPDAEKDFSKALQVNVAGTQSLFSAASRLDQPPRIVLISSSEVYGKVKPAALPLTEEQVLEPANNYSLTKAMSELVPSRFVGKVEAVIARPFNHTGPKQRDDFVVPAFAHQLACIAAGKHDPFISVGNLEAKRDFSNVKDIVRAYRLLAENGSGVYNLCSGESRSIESILSSLINLSGLEVEVRQDPERMRPSEVPEIRGSYKKAQADIKWKPEIDFETTLSDVYQYWLDVESR